MDHSAASLFDVTEIDIVYRNKCNPKDRRRIEGAQSAYDLLVNTWDANKIEVVEQFKIILLNQRNDCIGISEIATGGMTSCIVDPKIVFATAVKSLARSIILAHNHPSCSFEPSQADRMITEQLEKGGKLLDIRVLDHLIVTPYRYYSFADHGLMLDYF